MSTDVTVTVQYPATPATVYALITDAVFLQERMVAGGGIEPKVISVAAADGVTTVVTQQSIPADALPSMVSSMLGGDPVTERTEAWRSDGDGYAAEFSLTVKGAPASVKGRMTLTSAGAGSAFVVNGTATVPIPMFGAKLESVISEQMGAILSAEGEYTRSRLA